jgi:release factor glutamine methyltransferase
MTQTYHQLRLDLATALAQFLDPREANAEAIRWFEEGLDRSRAWIAAHGDEPVPLEARARVSGWLRRRKAGEPWAYILGWTEWRGRRFEVAPATLIPRPETELVLEAALDIGKRLGVRRAVDIGTGTGILGISLALETDWELTATDISAESLDLARRNAENLGARLNFALGHLLDPVPGPLGLVVSNPPYVDPADRASLQRELAWEPDSALFAPDRGLALSTELLREARRRAAPGCVLEIGADQGAELVERARRMGWKRSWVHKDMAGHDRVLMAIAG